MNKCFNLRRVIHNDNPSQTVEKGHRRERLHKEVASPFGFVASQND